MPSGNHFTPHLASRKQPGVLRSNSRKFWRHSVQASRCEARPVSRSSRLTFQKRMLGKCLLIVREPWFPVIKVRRSPRKRPFRECSRRKCTAFGPSPSRGWKGTTKNFEGLGLKPRSRAAIALRSAAAPCAIPPGPAPYRGAAGDLRRASATLPIANDPSLCA